MAFTFETAPLTVMLQCQNPETAIGRIQKSLPIGAEAFGLQVESLEKQYQNKETVQAIFKEMQGKPVYVTNYRVANNAGDSDEQLAQGMLNLADWGADLVDVMGDLYCRHDQELTDDPQAIEKQLQLIDRLHEKGAQVLMSSHVFKFTPAERVLAMALEQQRRGVDVCKIVTGAETMEQQLENLRITNLLKQELNIPFLFLSAGMSVLHRHIGPNLGACMYLCVYEHDQFSTKAQPLLEKVKAVRNNMEM